jgi:hypothetical protein
MALVSVGGLLTTAAFAHAVEREDRLEETTDEPAIPSNVDTQATGTNKKHSA